MIRWQVVMNPSARMPEPEGAGRRFISWEVGRAQHRASHSLLSRHTKKKQGAD